MIFLIMTLLSTVQCQGAINGQDHIFAYLVYLLIFFVSDELNSDHVLCQVILDMPGHAAAQQALH